jgi:hypothetical protein
MAFPARVPLACHRVGPMWPGSVGLAGAAPMPPCWPAGLRPRPLPSHGRLHGQRPCAGRPRRSVAGAHPRTETDPDTGVACQRVLCWLYPAGRLAHVGPVRPCPADVSCAGCVLPSRPSPWSGLSPPLRTLRDTTPPRHAARFPSDRTPPPPCPGCRRGAEVPAGCGLRVSPAVPQELSTVRRRLVRAGASGASQVLRRLSSCMPWPEDSGGPAPPRHDGGARVACGSVKTLGVRNTPFRRCPSTSGCAVTPTASRIRGRRFVPLVRRVYDHVSAMDARRDTGGWLALTRQGLSPCKRRQACLGAITLGLRRGWKRERGTSERCKPSPAGRC